MPHRGAFVPGRRPRATPRRPGPRATPRPSPPKRPLVEDPAARRRRLNEAIAAAGREVSPERTTGLKRPFQLFWEEREASRRDLAKSKAAPKKRSSGRGGIGRGIRTSERARRLLEQRRRAKEAKNLY